MSQPAVFLDRDGVINRNRPDHVKAWEEFEFLPDSFTALRELADLDLPVVVVTNQSVIGRGIARGETVDQINSSMVERVRAAGGRIDRVYYCPHRPDEGCDCRKPAPGLLLRAAEDLGLDLRLSFLVGDGANDVEAALRVGCTPLLVLTGRGRQAARLLSRELLATISIVDDLREAVCTIGRSINSGRPASQSDSSAGNCIPHVA